MKTYKTKMIKLTVAVFCLLTLVAVLPARMTSSQAGAVGKCSTEDAAVNGSVTWDDKTLGSTTKKIISVTACVRKSDAKTAQLEQVAVEYDKIVNNKTTCIDFDSKVYASFRYGTKNIDDSVKTTGIDTASRDCVVYLTNIGKQDNGYVAYTDNSAVLNFWSDGTTPTDSKQQYKVGKLDIGLGVAAVKNAKVSTQKLAAPAASDSGDSENATCEASGNSLSWAICPLVNGLAEASDGIFNSFIRPFLQTSTINVGDNTDPLVRAWSAFRNIANLVLVITVLVAVFGQAIGGGVFDAYTMKKMMPRLLIAAVLINLSLYIVAGLMDIFNILGHSLQSLMTQPFKDSGALNIKVDAGVSTLGIVAIVAVGFAAAIGGKAFLMFLLFAVLIPTFIAFLGVFATLIIRQGLILFLIMVSPIAFALYALPNTETYFKKWWDVLVKTLLVYPIIVVLFALSQILAGMISQANDTSGPRAALAQIAALIAMLIPLFLIPFAFKFAGGVVGNVAGAVTGFADKARKSGYLQRQKEHYGHEVKGRQIAARAEAVRNLNSKSEGAGFARKKALRFAAGRIGGHNIFAEEAARNAEVSKMMEEQKATGDDTEQRALTVNKHWADLQGNFTTDSEGYLTNGHVREKNGAKQYKTLGGRWVDEAAVDTAHHRWGNNVAAQQWALNYEMQKATTQDQQDYLQQNYSNVAQGEGGWGMTNNQAGGSWTGAAFANQNQNMQWKHYKYKDGGLKLDGKTLLQEVDEKKGNFQMSQQHADTWISMAQEAQSAHNTLSSQNAGLTQNVQQGETNGQFQLRINQAHTDAQEVLQRASRVATSTLSSSINGIDGVGAGAAGHVQEAMKQFVRTTDGITNGGVINRAPTPPTVSGVERRRSDTDDYGRPGTPRSS